jgi:hypothetical protein
MMKLGTEELTKRFLDEIKLRAYDDKYVDRREEREILQYAISAGIDLEVARQSFLEACRQKGFLVESTLLAQVREELRTYQQQSTRLQKQQVDSVIASLHQKVHGILSLADCTRLIIEAVECGDFRIQKGWFSNWFADLKKETGLG